MLVTIFGGGGFVGRYVAQELLTAGARVRVAMRSPGSAMAIKTLGGLGQVQLVHADVRRPETVTRALAGAQAAINLVSVLSGPLDSVNHHGAANVARQVAEAGISNFVHISAIGADVASASVYGRSKGQGEQAARSSCPTSVVIRPSIIFGREDQFTNRFARMIGSMPVLPVLAPNTKFQPVYVVDVAKAIANAILNPAEHAGHIYELGGPQIMTMLEINRFVAEQMERSPLIIPLPDAIGALIAALPGTPITRDQWKMLASDTVVSERARGLGNLGVEPTPIGAIAGRWLVSYRRNGRFSSKSRGVSAGSI